MNIGKISENVNKRSVLRVIQSNSRQDITSADLGEDCASFTYQGTKTASDQPGKPDCSIVPELVTTTAIVTYTERNMGAVAVYRVANLLAAAGAEPAGITVDILLAPNRREISLKRIMEDLNATAADCGMAVMQAQAEVANQVNHTVLTITGIGYRKNIDAGISGKVQPGQDIVMTKYIGVEGTYLLADALRDRITERLPVSFVDRIVADRALMDARREAEIAIEHGATCLHGITEGGVFAALWNMAERAGIGLRVDLKKIPVRQETIEFCELWNLNPYQLMSTGSLLAITDNGEELVEKLMEAGIRAEVIGQVTDNNDRIVVNEDETRYLDLPKSDEIHSILEKIGERL